MPRIGIVCAVDVIKVLGSILGHEELQEELLCLNHCFMHFYCLLQRKRDVESGLRASSLEQAI